METTYNTSHRVIVKSETFENNKAKQYFYIFNDNNIIFFTIRKLILSSNTEGFEGFKLIKTFKNKYLFEQLFSIKSTTLDLAIKAFQEHFKIL